MAGRPFTVEQDPIPARALPHGAPAGALTIVTGWAGDDDTDPVQCYPNAGAPFVVASVEELTGLIDDLTATTDVAHRLVWQA